MTISLGGLLASLPSPGDNAIHIGPLQLRAYGLMIAIGVIVAARIFSKRLRYLGAGRADDPAAILVWAVPAGVIGARLYHVATEWERFSDSPQDILLIWKGGLGVPGGILLGVVVAIVVSRRRGIDGHSLLWAAAPAIPVAQAIGRWGNWWNQELFGRPTTLPWGLEIDAEKVASAGYAPGTLFHPTFLYESLWNLGLAALLVAIGWRFMYRKPARLLALYCIGYGIGRFWIEGLRIDPAKEGGGLRLNQWTAIVLVVGGLAYLAFARIRLSRAALGRPAGDQLPSDE
jgi:prolipoprotein diacylglyceryl transferase